MILYLSFLISRILPDIAVGKRNLAFPNCIYDYSCSYLHNIFLLSYYNTVFLLFDKVFINLDGSKK